MRFEVSPDINPRLRPFVQIVKGFAAILGDDCEILLHDISRLERSVVVCANGYVTGRPLGSPMTGYGLRLLNSEEFSKNDGVHIYMARANNGALIKCGVIFLRDDEDKAAGLLCVHIDTTKARSAIALLDGIFSLGGGAREEPVNEFFGFEIEDVFKSGIGELKLPSGKSLMDLSKREKKEVLVVLLERGFFMMKGAVEYIAREMGNSKFTIYAYMREIARGDGGEKGRKSFVSSA
jgi:predicted transcriptional regulator YheO